MKTKDKVISIIAILAVFCWLIFMVKSVLAPFICSLVVAYFLDPMVDRLGRKYKLPRWASTSLILGAFLAIFSTLCALLIPLIYGQFAALVEALPGYFQIIATDFYPKFAASLNKAGIKIEPSLNRLIGNEQIATHFVSLSQNLFNNAITSSITLINILSLIFITPILIFYLLKDWDILIRKISDYLPRTISSSVKKIAVDIDKTLSGYLRGQLNVCFILAIIYSSMLSMTGLNFGFLIGFLTGFFSFIPFVGMLCGIIAATIVGLLQWGVDATHIMAITLVFIFGQIVESNFLTPKLIGSKIGLHPVWLIFGLFVFGTLFGFVGVIVAVPLTAICGVIIKHFALEYKRRFT